MTWCNMKRVLVTGSLGYLGSVLTSNLAEHGYDCIGYDAGFFKDSLLYPPPVTNTVFRDARDITEAYLKNIDVVVHLAGISNDPIGKMDAAHMYDPTREYTLAIARMCKKLGVRFVFASSCSIYGLGSDELLTEISLTHPQTAYSLNKLQIEEDLRSISDMDFSPIALRFATVFGSSPRLRFDVVINMLTGMAVADGAIILNSDGKSWRPNLHILDVCQAIRRAIDLEYQGGELLVLNVGADENNLQVIQIARIIQNVVPGCELKFLAENPELDKEGLIRDRKVKDGGGDTRTYKVSFEKIRRTFPGFKCEWSVEQGVKDMVALFETLSFSKELFKRRGFYRLQELEYLHGNGFLSDDLFWLKDSPCLQNEVIILNEAHIPLLSEQEIMDGLSGARNSTRFRYPMILHNQGDEFNQVVNFILSASYMQPHLHPGEEKIEKIYLIQGRVAMLFFDDQGAVTDIVLLEKGQKEIVEIPAFSWHTYLILSEYAITYETMMGKYDPRDWKEFADWAPSENSPVSLAYLNFLKEEVLKMLESKECGKST